MFAFEDGFDWFSNASGLIEIYKSHYPILSALSVEKAYVFLRLSPLIHELRDDFPKVERCLSMLLDMEVRISLSFHKRTIRSSTPPELGFALLGSTTIIGEVIEDGEPDLNVILRRLGTSECMRQGELHDYSFYSNKIRLTHGLCDFFVGAQYEVSVSFAFDDSDVAFSLDGAAVLGYGVCL